MKAPGRILLLLATVSFLLSACSSAKKVLHPNYRALAYAQAEDHGIRDEIKYAPATNPSKLSVQDISRPPAKQLKTMRPKAALRHLEAFSAKANKIKSSHFISGTVSGVQPAPKKTPAEVNHRLAVMGLIFSIIGIAGLALSVVAFPFGDLLLVLSLAGIAGLALSATALTRLKKGGNEQDKSLALAGMIIGIVDCAILLLLVIVVALIFVVLGGFGE